MAEQQGQKLYTQSILLDEKTTTQETRVWSFENQEYFNATRFIRFCLYCDITDAMLLTHSPEAMGSCFLYNLWMYVGLSNPPFKRACLRNRDVNVARAFNVNSNITEVLKVRIE